MKPPKLLDRSFDKNLRLDIAITLVYYPPRSRNVFTKKIAGTTSAAAKN